MRSRFNGSKRAKRASAFEKCCNKFKIFVQNLDKAVLIKSVLFVILFAIFIALFAYVYGNYRIRSSFEQDVLEFEKLNSKTLFKIDGITLYSSASATASEDGKGKIDISQFTDIYFTVQNIENRKIADFYICDISFFAMPELGTPYLLYKNPLDFGKLTNTDVTSYDWVHFEVLNSDTDIDYTKPYVLNNLSNPITLEYINKNVKTDFSIPTSTSLITYDGRLLKEANVDISKLNCSLSFHIVLVTAEGESYKCKVGITIPLKQDDTTIYDGNILENTSTNIYPFYRVK